MRRKEINEKKYRNLASATRKKANNLRKKVYTVQEEEGEAEEEGYEEEEYEEE